MRRALLRAGWLAALPAIAVLAALAAEEPRITKPFDMSGIEAPPPGHAQVMFVRTTAKERPVFLGERYVGTPPKRSCLGTTVAGGRHLLWGRKVEPEWVDLRPGRHYCFLLTDANRTSRWYLERPFKCKLAVEDLGLTVLEVSTLEEPATLTPADRELLEKATRNAGDRGELALPASFSGAVHTKSPLSFKAAFAFGGTGRGGELTVDAEALRYTSRRKTIAIPIASIHSVQFGGYAVNNPSPWLAVLHGDLGGLEVDHFSMGSRYNELFTALMEAVGSG